MLTPRMLDAFRAVILSGSISEAAGFLNVSQPAVSRLIKELEAEIGFRLFDRRHGRVYANEEALSLFEEVHQFYAGIERISKAAEQIRAHETGVLRVACMPAIGLSVMPRAIARFRNRYPGIDVSLQVVRSSTVIQFLTALQCDLGYVEESFTAASLNQGPVYDLNTVCILPPGHPLADREVITPRDLVGENFISLARDSKTRLKIDAIFQTAGVRRSIQTEAPLTSVLCLLVLEGCGVAIVDPLTADSHGHLGLVSRPFEPTVTFSFKALSASRASRTSLIEEFMEVFAETLPTGAAV